MNAALDWVVCIFLIVIGVLVLAISELTHQIRRLSGIADQARPRRGPVVDVDVIERDRLTDGAQKRRALWRG